MRVFNQRAHLKRRLTVVCCEAGTVTRHQLDQLRNDYILDWSGQIEIGSDGVMMIGGAGTRAFMEGSVVFIREAVGPQTDGDFQILKIRQWGQSRSADSRNGRLVFRILANLIGECVNFPGVETSHEPVVCSFVVDTSSGEIVEGYAPDGFLVQHMGQHDHVVIAVQNGTEQGFSAAGSKADMLSKVAAMPVPPELRQQTVDAIKRFDPSAAILYILINDGKFTVREMPWSALREALNKISTDSEGETNED